MLRSSVIFSHSAFPMVYPFESVRAVKLEFFFFVLDRMVSANLEVSFSFVDLCTVFLNCYSAIVTCS